MRATDFVDSYIDAWNHRDARRIAEHLAENGIYCDVTTDEQLSGEALITNLKAFFSKEDHHYKLLGDVLSSDASIAFQYTMVSPGSVSDDWRGAEFMTITGDGVIMINDYYERQAGVKSGRNVPPITLQKYAKSGLELSQLEYYSARLTRLMSEDKIYLDADLTLPKLASRVDCSVNHLSQVVNAGYQASFFNFLNSYRIEEAKRLLRKKNVVSQSILDVSFAAGFNSNSAFYAAFKKVTGQSPAGYRRDHHKAFDVS
ncbi:MAG: helix-turn-helix domain-containing protein [Porticoccaceae bacterium]|nr:helix-turn-helix domain-containing protein [Porticoccaceae bacterium]